MSDKCPAGSSAAVPDEADARRGQSRLLNIAYAVAGTAEGDLFRTVRGQRSRVPTSEPPERDVPGVIGATGLEELDDDTLLTRLERITSLEAMLAAEKAATLAATAARLCGVSADLGHANPRPGDRQAHGAERRWHNGLLRSVADETGLAVGLQRREASRRINASIDLVTRFPTTLQRMSDGRLPERAALAIAAELGTIQDPTTRRRVEDKVLAWVDRYGPMRVKRTARREAAKVNAEQDAMRHEARLDQRCVEMRPLDAGVAELAVSCSALHAAAVMNSLSKAAIQYRRDGDERTFDQLRADIAIQRLLGHPAPPPRDAGGPSTSSANPAHDSSGHPADSAHTSGNATEPPHPPASPDATGATGGTDTAVRTEIVIHCTAAEAAALATGTYATGGDLDGYGPLPQPALWQAFRTAKLRYHLTDREPIGDPDRYQPSTALARHIVDRDRTCRAPGCGQPAIRCDIDHRTEHPTGKTNRDNCAALCRHHHRLKHRGGWKVRRLHTGEHTWTTPTGRTYTVPPPDH